MSNESNQPGWRPPPKTPLQWHQLWTTELKIHVPSRRGYLMGLELTEVKIPESGTRGEPALLRVAKDGREFYVVFQRGKVFRAMDKPVLVYPPEAGPGRAFWVLPV